MRRPFWRPLAEVTLVVVVLIAALSVFEARADHVGFHSDESRYLSRARFFAYLFLQWDVTRSDWGDSNETHTQPMVTNYIVGGWLWAHGYDVEQRPSGYNGRLSFEENRIQGRLPDPPLLRQTRAPMVILAATGAVLVYALASLLGGPLAGLSAAAFAILSPLAQERMVRAVSEAPLTFFMLLGVLIGLLGTRRGRDGSIPFGWAVGLGVVLGLGFGAKLTGLLGIVAVAAWGGLVGLRAAWQARQAGLCATLGRIWTVGRGWALAAVVAVGVFILSDPHLYPDPPRHIHHLFDYRSRDLSSRLEAALREPTDDGIILANPLNRPGYVLGGSLINGTVTGSRGVPLEAILATIGAGALALTAWHGLRSMGRPPAEGQVLLTVLAYFGGTSAALTWPTTRYFIPTFFLGAVLSGVGIGAIIRLVAAAMSTLQSRPGVLAPRSPGGTPAAAATAPSPSDP